MNTTLYTHCAAGLGVLLGALFVGSSMGAPAGSTPPRPQGPCDIYAAAGSPCVAAHSTTRALYASYSGPLYEVKRESDGRTLDIGVVQPSASPTADPGGYANASAQDAFCANTICVINRIYDQSPKGNHLYQAPPGPSFPGPAKGGFDTQPLADMAPVTLSGHRVYGVFIMPGMGLRNNDAKDIPIGDEPEGIYYVIDGKHFDSGCCFDYGNASTNGRAVGTGTMETTYFGTSTVWGRGSGVGPWIMADMEAGLFSGYNAKQNDADPTVDSWRFVTAVVNGGGGNRWELRGGNAQDGRLTTFYQGVRPGSRENNAYYPMHKQGAILLGTGGDNGNGSAGTYYEGVMTAGYPTERATDEVQANIVAAKYDVQRLSVSRLVSFSPGSTQEVTATFTNTTGAPVSGLKLSIAAPAGWRAGPPRPIDGPLAQGASVSASFRVTSPASTGAGFLTAKAEWTEASNRRGRAETITQRVRNVLPVKINEVRFGAGNSPTGQFIELYNASPAAIDLSNWTLVHTPSQWASVKLATIPAGTKLGSRKFYLLGLANSGLAAPAAAGDSAVILRSVAGLAAGQQIVVDGEARSVVSVGTAVAPMTKVFIPVSTLPWTAIPPGSANLPVTSAAGFATGEKIGIDAGGKYEIATVTAVGKAATQTTLSAAVAAGAKSIQVAAGSNILAGDMLTIGTGARKETVRVATVSGAAIELDTPLKFDHAIGIDVSDPGTGISFAPPTTFSHASGDALQALGSGVVLDRPLASAHTLGAPVVYGSGTEGYQGPPAPEQWFGASLSPTAGSLALLDARGVLVDGVVYGSQQSNSSANGTITSPEIATLEAEQGQGGCIVVAPGVARAFGGAATAAAVPNRSVGRFPDGADADSLCTDFLTQAATTTASAAAAGATNIKVAAVTGFLAGQTIVIDSVANSETAVISAVGTAGATTVRADVAAGATTIPVASSLGFTAGQTITVDTGGSEETTVVAGVSGGRGGASLTVSAPLKMAHSANASLSGSGITLSAPLTRGHAAGTQVAASLPTPGAPNRYQRAAR